MNNLYQYPLNYGIKKKNPKPIFGNNQIIILFQNVQAVIWHDNELMSYKRKKK